jgi:hypothetical protein
MLKQYGTCNTANTHRTDNTQVQRLNDYHLEPQRSTSPIPNQHHNYSMRSTYPPITDSYIQSTHTPNTHKPAYTNKALLRQPKCNTDIYTRQHDIGGGTPNMSRKRKAKTNIDTTIPHLTAATLTKLLDTCTDTKFAEPINRLPDTWHSKTIQGTTLTKKLFTRCILGSYKDDQSVSQFQIALLLHTPTIHSVTQ